jgi:hypothetical protein
VPTFETPLYSRFLRAQVNKNILAERRQLFVFSSFQESDQPSADHAVNPVLTSPRAKLTLRSNCLWESLKIEMFCEVL